MTDISRLRELAEAMTPGPWEWNAEQDLHGLHVCGENCWDDQHWLQPIITTDSGHYGPRGADRELIALVPDMLAIIASLSAEVERLRGEREGIVERCARMCTDAGVEFERMSPVTTESRLNSVLSFQLDCRICADRIRALAPPPGREGT